MQASESHDRFAEELARESERPVVTWALVAANVAVYLAMVLSGVNAIGPSSDTLIVWGANFGPLTAGGEWWRLLSAIFIHGGLLHVTLNLWALFDAGGLVERLFGRTAFAGLYLASGLCGSLAGLVWNPERTVSVGASGAVFGVLGMLLAFLATHRHLIPGSVLRALRNSAMVFVGYSLVFGFIQPGIDNAAHLGGLAAGFLLGLPVSRRSGAEPALQPGPRRLAVGFALSAVLLGMLAFLVPRPTYDYHREQALRAEIARYMKEEAEILARWRAILKQRKEDRIGDVAMAELVEDGPLAQWQEAYDRLLAVKLSPGSPSREHFAQLLRYTALQRDSTALYVDLLRRPDPAKAARFKELQRELDRLRKEIAEPGGGRPPGSGANIG